MCGGGLKGWGEGEKSVVAMETGREELGLCAVGGGGVLSVSLETVLRPLHLHCTVHDKLQEAGGQEVPGEHRSLISIPPPKKEAVKLTFFCCSSVFTMGYQGWAISDTSRWEPLICSQEIYHK